MRDTAPGFELDSKLVGAFPLVNPHLEAPPFQTDPWQAPAAARPARTAPTHSALGFLLRNLVLAHAPLYSLGEWAREGVPALMGLEVNPLSLVSMSDLT